MDNIKFISVDSNKLLSNIKEIISWDTNHYCFLNKEIDPDLSFLFEEHFLMQIDDILIGYGSIFFIPINKKSYIAFIINKKYRNMGFGSQIIEYLVNYIKKEKNCDEVVVEILKKNKKCISLIEKLDFDFDYFDDEKIVFKKCLKM